MHLSPQLWGRGLRDLQSQFSLEKSFLGPISMERSWAGKEWDPISKNTTAKGAGGEAEVLEHLPSKCNAEFRPQYQQKNKKVLMKHWNK
jgi:hypothetical protein